jgi:hypothetical protein
MGLRDYEFQGSTWQFEEGQQPEGAFPVDGPALADSVFLEIDEANRADAIEAEKATAQAAEAEAARIAQEAADAEAAEKATAEAAKAAGEKLKTPQNTAATPATK